VLTTLTVYVIGAHSKGTPNLPIYEEWARDISQGLLFELYQVKDGLSISESLGNLIVPYPPITLLAFWLFTQMSKVFVLINHVSYGFIVNLSAVAATFATALGLSKFGRVFGSKTYFYFLFSPVVFLLSPILGYQDSLMVLFLLLGIHKLNQSRFIFAGIFFGLSLMTKQLSLMPLAAIALVLLLQRKWLPFTRILTSAILVVSFVLSPFILSGNLVAYVESQALASVHTMLAAQTANFPYLITIVHRMIQDGFWQGMSSGGNGLRIFDDQLRQLTYFGFALIAISVFCTWLLYFKRKHGLSLLSYWHVAAMMIFTYYLFCAGVHENHIYMALPILLCLPAASATKSVYVFFSTALFLHLIISWGIGGSFPTITNILSNSGTANSVGTLISLVLYFFSYIQLWRLPPGVDDISSANNFNSRQRKKQLPTMS
jgi:hypothetical protein